MPNLPEFGDTKEQNKQVKHVSLPKIGLIGAIIIAVAIAVIGLKTLSSGSNSNQYQGFIKAAECTK